MWKHRIVAGALCLAGAVAAASRPVNTQAEDPARRERLAWFHEAKYGLFIHWGLYAIPAGEWKGKRIPGIGEWIMNRAQIPVREYERLWLEQGPVSLTDEVRWGEWTIRSTLPGLKVRGWRPGDRLAGRSKKIQDVFVDAKIPRSERESWPLVVRGSEVVAVPGIVEAEGVSAERVAD